MRVKSVLPRGPSLAALGCFVALAVFWLLWTPYRPDRVESAIPAAAHWISWHEAPGERWEELSGNPLVSEILSGLLGPDDAQAVSGRRLPRRLRRLTGDRVIWSRVTLNTPSRERAAWLGAAWAGRHGRYLRWQLKWLRVQGFRRYGSHGGRPLYRVEWPGMASDQWFTLTFEDGLLLASYSQDPHDLRLLLDTHDGLLPSLRDRDRPSFPPVPDRAVLRIPGAFSPEISFSFSLLTPAETRADIRLGTALPGPAPAGPILPLPEPPWGGRPEILAAGPTRLLHAVPLPPEFSFLREELRAFLAALGEPPAWMVGIFGPPHTGRYRGMRMPGVLLAMRTDIEPAAFASAVDRWLDRLNAERQWGLIQAPDVNAAGGIRRIMGTAPNPFGTLPRSEVPAVALVHGHVLLASNAEMLSGLLDALPGPCRFPSTVHGEQALHFWMDAPRAMPTLHLAYGGYGLYQIMERREPGPLEMAVLEPLGRKLDFLKKLGEMEIRIRMGPSSLDAGVHAIHPEKVDTPCTGSSI